MIKYIHLVYCSREHLNLFGHWNSVHPESQWKNLNISFVHWHHSLGSYLSKPIQIHIQDEKNSHEVNITGIILIRHFASSLLCNEVLFTALPYYTKSHAIIWYCIDHSPSSHWYIYSRPICSSATWQKLHLLQGGHLSEVGHDSLYESLCLHDNENFDSLCNTEKIFVWFII